MERDIIPYGSSFPKMEERIKALTIGELFQDAFDYFKENKRYFNIKKQFILFNIEEQRPYKRFSKKQMEAFIEIVNVVRRNEPIYKEVDLEIKAIFEVILTMYDKSQTSEQYYNNILQYRDQIYQVILNEPN